MDGWKNVCWTINDPYFRYVGMAASSASFALSSWLVDQDGSSSFSPIVASNGIETNSPAAVNQCSRLPISKLLETADNKLCYTKLY
jgi:hypothetical protein